MCLGLYWFLRLVDVLVLVYGCGLCWLGLDVVWVGVLPYCVVVGWFCGLPIGRMFGCWCCWWCWVCRLFLGGF